MQVEGWSDAERMMLRAELPGASSDDVELTLVGRDLRLRGPARLEQQRGLSREGCVERLLRLPAGTRPEDVSAEFSNGVLTVTVPLRHPAPRPLRVTQRRRPVT